MHTPTETHTATGITGVGPHTRSKGCTAMLLLLLFHTSWLLLEFSSHCVPLVCLLNSFKFVNTWRIILTPLRGLWTCTCSLNYTFVSVILNLFFYLCTCFLFSHRHTHFWVVPIDGRWYLMSQHLDFNRKFVSSLCIKNNKKTDLF